MPEASDQCLASHQGRLEPSQMKFSQVSVDGHFVIVFHLVPCDFHAFFLGKSRPLSRPRACHFLYFLSFSSSKKGLNTVSLSLEKRPTDRSSQVFDKTQNWFGFEAQSNLEMRSLVPFHYQQCTYAHVPSTKCSKTFLAPSVSDAKGKYGKKKFEPQNLNNQACTREGERGNRKEESLWALRDLLIKSLLTARAQSSAQTDRIKGHLHPSRCK